MIEFTTGDILKADTQALVNTVNCVGHMGRGIAAQFKRAFPSNFKAYSAACKRDEVQPGSMFIVESNVLSGPRYIVNFPTKRHWRGKSRIEDIRTGLAALVREVLARDITSIAVPPLGCGLGGLDWATVRRLIEAAFRPLQDVRVLVFEPAGAPSTDAMATSTDVPALTRGRAFLVGLMDRYLAGLMDPFVTLLEVQKLMYFAQEAGEPLRLRYVKAPYGPYAENLRHVLSRIEGHLVSGYRDGGDAPDMQLSLVPGARDDARSFLANHPDALERFERVAALVDGFETPFGLELLATVHWVATREDAHDLYAVVRAVHAWAPRERAFQPEQMAITLDRLTAGGWLEHPAP